jgi:hypothetical protein
MTQDHISGANGIYHCDPQGEYFLKIYSLLKYRGNTAGVFLVRYASYAQKLRAKKFFANK